jgi:MYXO-CTERM domain-containing protein
MRAAGALLFGSLLAMAPALAQAAEPFEYDEPGVLAPGSGSGREDAENYAPEIRFPIEEGPAYANSQVWGNGGNYGPGGSACDDVNYSYPWRDNYCESRSWDMPLCPSGVGHQGQDIRAATCDDLTYWTVAATDGTVTNIGSYSVYVTADDGTRYDYLHGNNNIVSEGQRVQAEERLNQVSNAFGDGGWTTIHLHFNIKQDVAGVGFVYVPPYMALVESYERLMGLDTAGAQATVESKDCSAIVGWAQNLDAPDEPATIEVFYGGPRDDPSATGVEYVADYERSDLCDTLGSCDHGFEVAIPRRLRDGQTYPAYVYVLDGKGGATEAEDSPIAFACAGQDLPAGVKRSIDGPEVLAAWGLSPFLDGMAVDDDTLDEIDDGEALPAEPSLVLDEDSGTRYLVDDGVLREVPTEAVAAAWRLDWNAAEPVTAESLAELQQGPSLPAEPFLLEADDGRLYVMDAVPCEGDACDVEDDDGDVSGTDGGAALPAGQQSQEGCGCRSSGPSAPLSVLWFALLLLRRKRR